MLSLYPSEHLFCRAPQIDMGTGDFYPGPTLGGSTFQLLPASSGAPAGLSIGSCYAHAITDPDGWTVQEFFALFPYSGAQMPAMLSDIRPPTDFIVTMRSSHTFPALVDYQAAVKSYRQNLNEPVPCLISKGRRLSDLDTNFPNLSTAVETWDVLVNQTTVGVGVIARQSATLTSHHWVIFSDTQLFDNVRCLKRSQSFPSTQAFFTEMQNLRNTSPVPFQHAVELCTHYADVPW